MSFYQNLLDKISLLERQTSEKALQDSHMPWYLNIPKGGKARLPWFVYAEDLPGKLKLRYYKTLLALTRIWMIIKGVPSSNFWIFTQAGKDGIYICNYSYCYYKGYHKNTKWKFLAMVTASTIIVSLIVALVFPGKPYSRAATNTWNQTDWSLGADIAALANHIANQTGWQKFYSKDANVNVSTAGEVKLSATTSGITETTTADFSAGTQSNTGAVSNSVLLLKPAGASCVASGECAGLGTGGSGGVCLTSICSSGYIYTTQCAGINIYYADLGAPTTYQWKTTNDTCDTPQCGINGGQDGDNLVDPIANPSVVFTSYPAQNACKAIDGRLPTKAELACLYTNKASLGTFQASTYWSSTEYSAAYAWNQSFVNGVVNANNKTNNYYVRCVRGQ